MNQTHFGDTGEKGRKSSYYPSLGRVGSPTVRLLSLRFLISQGASQGNLSLLPTFRKDPEKGDPDKD